MHKNFKWLADCMVMRWLALLLIIPSAFALSVSDVSVKGDNPSLYGDSFAFEDAGRVKVFDVSHGEAYDVGPGANPSLFGFNLAYGDAGLVKYVNVRDRTVVTIGQGVFPSIYADKIVFSTKEMQLGADVSNDSDRDDDIIQEYDVTKSELKNLGVVGKYPVSNQRYIVFVTEESQVSVDLNSDGDKNDGVLRVFDRESREVSNAKVEGRGAVIGREGTVAFVSQGRLGFMDARSRSWQVTELKGEDPSIHDDTILFSKDNELFGYSVESGVLARLEKGESPSIFDEQAAIVQLGMIRVIADDDGDKDGVSDFVDNCPGSSASSSDADKNGVGDSCEKKVERVEPKPVQQVVPQNESAVSPPANEQSTASDELAWYWYVLIIAAVVVVGPYAWKFAIRYYKKRKKSFGF